MKQCGFSIRSMVALVGLTAAAGAVQAADGPDGALMARMETIAPGGQQFQVVDRDGNKIEVVRPVQPHGMISFYRDGNLVNSSALHNGDRVLLTGVGHGNWFEASRAEILTGERVGGATAPEQVLRFTGFVSGRELRAVSADGTKYRIVFPPRPQEVSFWKDGNLAELAALREGDIVIPHGAMVDHTIVANRLEALEESRLGRGAPMPLLLTYRGSAGWRLLIGEAADGTRYLVRLPRRPQALYYVRNGSLVETSALRPGDTIEVHGFVHDDQIDASEVVLR